MIENLTCDIEFCSWLFHIFQELVFQIPIMSMSKSKGGGCVTRGDSEIFLIGPPQESLDSGGKLPVSRKVLQYLKYLQSLPGEKTRPVKTQICCPLQTKTNTAVCSTGNTGCSTLSGNNCVVAAVTSYWRMAGIPTIPASRVI